MRSHLCKDRHCEERQDDEEGMHNQGQNPKLLHPTQTPAKVTMEQMEMATRIDSLFAHKYEVICMSPLSLSSQTLSTTMAEAQIEAIAEEDRKERLRRMSSPMTKSGRTSFGADKYKHISAAGDEEQLLQQQPNLYRLAGHELTVTGFESFHSFYVWIYPNGVVDVESMYPHHGALGGISKFIAYCEIGPQTETRSVLIQETLDDAMVAGIISYVATNTDRSEKIVVLKDSKQVHKEYDDDGYGNIIIHPPHDGYEMRDHSLDHKENWEYENKDSKEVFADDGYGNIIIHPPYDGNELGNSSLDHKENG